MSVPDRCRLGHCHVGYRNGFRHRRLLERFKESKFKDLSLSDSEECHNDTYKSTDRGRSIQGGYNTRRGSKRHLLKKK